MPHTALALLLLALFAGAALAQSAAYANKASAASYKDDEYDSEYKDTDDYDRDYDHHKSSKHGRHSKGHSKHGDKHYKMTITLNVTNYQFTPEGAAGVGQNGVFRFNLRESATGPIIGDGVITGTFYSALPAGMPTTFLANEVLSIQFTDGDFEDSTLTAIGRLGWKVESMTDGAIVPGTDTLTVTGGSGDLLGAAGTFQLVGGTRTPPGAYAVLKLTVPKH